MPESDTEQQLRRLITEACGKDALGVAVDADLVSELGLDSLAGLRVLAAVEKQFEVRFPDTQLGDFHTLEQLRDFIQHQRGGTT